MLSLKKNFILEKLRFCFQDHFFYILWKVLQNQVLYAATKTS